MDHKIILGVNNCLKGVKKHGDIWKQQEVDCKSAFDSMQNTIRLLECCLKADLENTRLNSFLPDSRRNLTLKLYKNLNPSIAILWKSLNKFRLCHSRVLVCTESLKCVLDKANLKSISQGTSLSLSPVHIHGLVLSVADAMFQSVTQKETLLCNLQRYLTSMEKCDFEQIDLNWVGGMVVEVKIEELFTWCPLAGFISKMDIMMHDDKPMQTEKDKWIEQIEDTHIESAVMNRLVMDYLVTEGYKEAAEKFEAEAGVSASDCFRGIERRIEIRDAILKGDISEAISFVNDLHPELLDDNRGLLFYLQLQQLIELIRMHRTEEALEFAQTSLCEQSEESPECLTDMERALALLAFEKPEESPFLDLLCPAQRHKVWSRVNTAIMDHENRESVPRLTKLMKLLLWSESQLDAKGAMFPKMTEILNIYTNRPVV